MSATPTAAEALQPTRGSSLYYSLLFAEPALRPLLAAVHGVGRQVAQIPMTCSDPGVARTKLAWWEEELERLYGGRPLHPLTQTLAPRVAQLPREEFERLLLATLQLLEQGGYPDFAEQRRQAAHLGGAVARLDARLSVQADTETLAAVECLGSAVTLTRQLRDLLPTLHQGHRPLPDADLHHHGVTLSTLAAGQPTPALEALLAAQTQRIQALFQEGRERLPAPRRTPLRHQLILARLHETLLRELVAEGAAGLAHHTRLTPLRKLWIAWRTARAHRPRGARGVSRAGQSR